MKKREWRNRDSWSWRVSSPCRSYCRLWGACSETLTRAETPAQTASSWDGRWLLNPCWLSETTEVKTFVWITLHWKKSRSNKSNEKPQRTKLFLVPELILWNNVYARYLLSLDLTAEVWDLDLHGVELFIWDLGDGKRLGLLWALEGQLRQGDVPLTVILLVFTAARWGKEQNRYRLMKVDSGKVRQRE